MSKEDEIVGHIRLQMYQYISKFLKRRTNNGKAIITGKRVNRGAGYGLEIPCSYIFNRDSDISIPWLREKMESTGVFDIGQRLENLPIRASNLCQSIILYFYTMSAIEKPKKLWYKFLEECLRFMHGGHTQ